MSPARILRSLLVVVLAAGASGCHRKAPGPAECIALARASYGVRSAKDLRIPGMKERVDELTTECLLTPYDRELVECTLEGGAPRSCLRAFKLRHSGLETTRPGTQPGERRRVFGLGG